MAHVQVIIADWQCDKCKIDKRLEQAITGNGRSSKAGSSLPCNLDGARIVGSINVLLLELR
jgi:hypothetical protein